MTKTFREFDLDEQADIDEIKRIENTCKVIHREVFTYNEIGADKHGRPKEITLVKLLMFWDEKDGTPS